MTINFNENLRKLNSFEFSTEFRANMTQRDVGSAALFKNPTYSEVHDVLVT